MSQLSCPTVAQLFVSSARSEARTRTAETQSLTVSQPFTFAESLKKFPPVGVPPVPNIIFVQVLINRVSTCAKLVNGWTARDGTFLWALDLQGPFVGSGSFPERMVRQCSGVDGQCECAGELAAALDFRGISAPGFCHGRVVAPRDSLNIEKTPLLSGI